MKLILLIDDDATIRATFGMALQASGYRVIEADSGLAGLEVARQQLPDLILSDINMPGGGGQALLQEIRADPDLCSKQVVLMTGRPDMVSPRKGMEQGADDFLLKPISLESLLACVSARLNRSLINWRVEDQALSKMRTAVTSVLPHEFFTPLAGIVGLSEILSSGMQNFAPNELKEIHQDIHQSALNLHRTLRNYLHMLEINPDVAAEPPSCLLPPKLRESIWAGVDAAKARHQREDDVSVQWAECPLRVSPSDLTLIVEELVDNALRYSRAGLPVSLRLTGEGALVVTDAGRGMSEEEIEQIGAFRQFDRKKYEQQGLGLGLTLVQKLAARNRAQFAIERRPENGIKVTVSFQYGP